MSWAYRCCRCRGRNTLKHKFEWYKIEPKCRHCGFGTFIPPEGSKLKPVLCKIFYLDKARQYRNDACNCDGYHFKHRINSPFCHHNKDYEFNDRVGRQGQDPAEARREMAERDALENEGGGNASCIEENM